MSKESLRQELSVAGLLLIASLALLGGACNPRVEPTANGNGADSNANSKSNGVAKTNGAGKKSPVEDIVTYVKDEAAKGGAVGSTASECEPAPAVRITPPRNIQRTIYADVVAIDQPFMVNRLGASQPGGMIFVLKDDLVAKQGTGVPTIDNFKLRVGKRPRPIVLRMNVGDVLQINFENWLQSLLQPDGTPFAVGAGNTPTQKLAQLPFFVQKTRYTGIHVAGLSLVPEPNGAVETGINSDGSWVGKNQDAGPPAVGAKGSLVKPGGKISYRLYAQETGTFLLSSAADTTVHQLNAGLFGAVNVQPKGAEWYRSQTTRCEMQAATLEKEDLRSNELTLGEFRKPAKADDAAQAPPADEAIVSEARIGLEAMSLTDTGSGVRAPTAAKVYMDGKGRLYSELQQPLINYHAVFKDKDVVECPGAVLGKPILSMLKVIATEKPKEHKLERVDGYRTEIERLDSGFITFSLRELFKSLLNVDLAADASVARVANENIYSWVVTNPGKTAAPPEVVVSGTTYLVQGHESTRTVTIGACELHLVHSDLTAIITGPNAGNFPYSQDIPDFYTNPASPDRRQPYREFTIIYHQGGNVVQAFPEWSNNNLFRMISAGLDQFGINYGFAAIGPEIVANRLGVGPMGNAQQPVGASGPVGPGDEPKANQPNDAVDLKYEEFFLSSWCVGDPAMIVDVPANVPNQFVSNPEQGSAIVGKVEANPVQFDSFKPLTGLRPTKAFYPDDPSNVYHGYMRDHTKMRVLHAGPGPAHVHHLHAHQWLHSPNSPEATYLDSQLILPGSTYTLEITYNGSGNRNQTVGDSIFHCHFYPHFAKGMWSLWRVHDTFEEGTELDKNGVCVSGKPNRALPDGEIAAGTPTPAIVPLPTLGMAPMPAQVKLTDLSPWYKNSVGMGRRVEVIPKNWDKILGKFDKDGDGKLSDQEHQAWEKAIEDAVAANKQNNVKYGEPGYQWVWYALYDNPGYPFFVPGVGGHRPPHPPMDMAWKEDADGDKTRWTDAEIENELGIKPASDAAIKAGELQYLDGGLPRHVVLGGDIVSQYQTRWDFTKDFVKTVDQDGKELHVGGLYAYQLPEDGTPVERAAMKAHATRTHAARLPKNGEWGNFILNGLPPIPGAPYADPSVTDDGNSSGTARRYQAAVIQTDVVLNKKGWHYPQQRFITLWEDVASTVENVRPPQPFFIRTSTNDATELWHTNLVPNYYELDDFQVRTPTDVIGQHIHLVKFDVTASDGAANGWNYEDGTFGADEVRERIHAISNVGGLYGFDPRSGFVDKAKQKKVAVWPNKFAYPKRGDVGTEENGLFGSPPPGQDWEGAMTTIQRWAIDPLLNWQGHDRTLRTVFTHDHFSPSTHQQVGLYAGVLVEPQGSQWYLPDGKPMNVRTDGGPTSWQGIIVTADPADTHREYAIEFQDMQLAYTADAKIPGGGSSDLFKPKLTGAALTNIRKLIKDYPDFAGQPSKPPAPAAFYIGQVSVAERNSVQGLIQLLQDTDDGDPVPAQFPKIVFPQYGIALSSQAKVYTLDSGDPLKGFFGAQWLFLQPALEPAGPLNGGDYYILQVTDPIPIPNTTASTSRAISVFTPSIAPGYADPPNAVNPNWGSNLTLANGQYAGNIGTPGGPPQQQVNGLFLGNPTQFGNGAPYPSLVSTRANGTYSANYRNEPVPLRVASGNAQQTDLAYAFSSIERADKQLNVQPPPTQAISPGSPYNFPPYLIPPGAGGPQETDPFTPLIRGYTGDDIQIRTLVGAHLQPHAFTIHGVKWLAQPSYMNSGYRNVQGMGLSEHFEMRFKMPSAVAPRTGTKVSPGADYFYSVSTGAVGLSNGAWGIMRSYDAVVGTPPPDPMTPSWETDYMLPLVNNPKPKQHVPINFEDQFNKAKRKREFVVHAMNQALNYNPRANDPYVGPDGIIFVLKEETQNGKLVPVPPSGRIEPLVLRAAAGEWIKVTLKNDFNSNNPTFGKKIAFPFGNDVPFNGLNDDPDLQPIGMKISKQVGLHPQLVEFDVTAANGINVGLNPDSTAGPLNKQHPNEVTYYWYAGEFKRDGHGQIVIKKDGQVAATPIEFGATNLVGADLVLQTSFGLVGSLVIEPEGSSWDVDTVAGETGPRRTFATVRNASGSVLFRECVLVMQNLVAGKLSSLTTVPGFPPAPADLKTVLTPGRETLAQQTDGRDAGFGAVNYRTEKFAARNIPAGQSPDLGFAQAFSNSLPPPAAGIGDPVTPIFTAVAGVPVRFRVVMPSTTSANSSAQPLVFAVHGHGWQDEPYVKRSTAIGHNSMAQFIGAQKVTVTQKYDIVLDSAGGPFRVPGDYLYQAYNQEQKIGIWGIFRVAPAKK